MAKSKDLTPPDAAIKIMELNSADEITVFIEGDKRRSVIQSAEARIKELSALISPPSTNKQGDQSGPITKDTHDFKDGIQGTKEFSSSNPGTLEPLTPRSYVTCEDVIEKMRKAGKQI